MSDVFGSQVTESDLALLKQQVGEATFDKDEYESEAKLSITRVFMFAFFASLVLFFLLSAGYDLLVMLMTRSCIKDSLTNQSAIELCKFTTVDIGGILSLLMNGLTSIFGFIIGYYFKPKGD